MAEESSQIDALLLIGTREAGASDWESVGLVAAWQTCQRFQSYVWAVRRINGPFPEVPQSSRSEALLSISLVLLLVSTLHSLRPVFL